MFNTFITRSNSKATIIGVSSYQPEQGREFTQYSGTVDGKLCCWNHKGQYATKRVIEDTNPHPLDLVDMYEEVIKDPGVYYFEFKGNKCRTS